MSASGLLTTGATVAAPGIEGVTAVPGVAAGWTGTVAAADVVAVPAAELAAELVAGAVADSGVGAEVVAGAS